MTLSIIIPSYNEATTLPQVLDAVRHVELVDHLKKEIIIVDDCSKDHTPSVVESYQKNHADLPIRYFRHEQNQGKGAALRTGIQVAAGDFILIQDADLEYNPMEYNLLLEPILYHHANVVYGSRFMSGKPHRILFFWHSIGNRFLTFCSNMFTNLNLTDMETCYKLFRADIIKGIEIQENRFGFEPEVTAKISRLPELVLYEVGISYHGRTYAEGKKINWQDGFRALYCILKYNLFR
ncbi:MAG: glycosyltransferase family 2 protein [Bacteroidota bacterium]